MRVAIAAAAGEVSRHFGRSDEFVLATIEDGTVRERSVIARDGADCATLPEVLKSNGVDTLVVGGLGPGAQARMEEAGVSVKCGILGTIDSVLASLAEGTLGAGQNTCGDDEDSGCDEHHHHHHHHG